MTVFIKINLWGSAHLQDFSNLICSSPASQVEEGVHLASSLSMLPKKATSLCSASGVAVGGCLVLGQLKHCVVCVGHWAVGAVTALRRSELVCSLADLHERSL